MDCQSIREQCATGVDEDPRVREHLADCAECRVAVETLRQARSALDAWPRSEAPADIAAVIAAAESIGQDEGRSVTRNLARPASRRSTLVGLAAGIIAFVLLSVVGARVETGGGVMRITFGKSPERVVDQAQQPSIDSLVDQKVAEKLDPVVRALVAATERSVAAQRDMLAEFASAVDYENLQDRALDEAREQRIVDGFIDAIAYRGRPHQP